MPAGPRVLSPTPWSWAGRGASVAGPRQNGRPAAAGRLPELDALRGSAAFAVLIFHTLHVIGEGRLPPWLEQGRAVYALTVHSPLRPVFFGREAVLFFFVLSGYVLTRSLMRSGSPGLLAFAAQRTIRLGLPVGGAVLASAALYLLLFDPAAEPFLRQHGLGMWQARPSLALIAGNIGLIGGDDDFRLDTSLWSLVHEWRLTVFLPVVLAFRGRPWALLVAALVLTALGLAGNATENGVNLGPHLHSSMLATLYFSMAIAAGASLALAEPPPLVEWEHRLAAGIAAAALISMQSDFAVYAGSALLILLAQGPGRFPDLLRTAPLVWLGRVSFSLYLVHMPVMAAALATLHGRVAAWVAALAGAILSLPAAALLHRLVELPSRRLARRAERALARGIPEPGRRPVA